jgi:phospholipase C
MRNWIGAVLAGCAAWVGVQAAQAAPLEGVPRYSHIFLIIEENHTFDQVIGNKAAPNFNKLAKQYGLATEFYAERHPSEPNYIAILGGDTFGISDDDAYFCKPSKTSVRGCDNASDKDYVDHTIAARSLVDQLSEHGLTWKGYFEDIPAPGSGEDYWPTPRQPVTGKPNHLYAVKHNGFMFFKSVQDDPKLARKIVGFDQLSADLASGKLPTYAHIVPNQCNDMHGLGGANVAEDCEKGGDKLITRADTALGALIDKLTRSSLWRGAENVAIVITFDENDALRPDGHGAGCCGSGAGDPSNPGGGWIPTIVMANHGPRGVGDPTPYNHYSLLRTTEDAFGISEHLAHAADTDKGVAPMALLFAVRAP